MELVIVTSAIILMLFHWLGDFIFQSRYMAENKSRIFSVLVFHCILYSLTMLVGVFVTAWVVGFLFSVYIPLITFLKLVSFFGLILIFHLLTDAVTSQLTTKYYATGKNKKFWATIGFDQWLHTVQILLIFWLIFI